jgi:hypothetical protein
MSAETALMKITSTLTPSCECISRDIADFKKNLNGKPLDEIADSYANRICWKYASAGAASALPGVIPGLGTAAQLAIEGGSISGDLLLMIRWMGSMVAGIGMIYGRDVTSNFNQDFIKVLGMWCGVLKGAKEASKRVGTKVAIAQFKKVSPKIFAQINKKVGTTIITKYGTKRGGIAIGRLIPFGVGAAVGGSFNLVTMKFFKKKAIEFYSNANGEELYMEG